MSDTEYDCIICGHPPHGDNNCNEFMKMSWPQQICDCPSYKPDK